MPFLKLQLIQERLRRLVRVMKGSITVFLSLVLVLILAFVGTMLEGVRLHMAKGYTERALLSGMDTVLTSYYRPLYEDYHLFFLEKGLDEKEEKGEIEKEIKSCMQAVFSPEERIYNKEKLLSADLLGSQVLEVTVEELTKAVDYQGKLFASQAIAYMKFKGLEKVFKKSSEKSEMVKTSKETARLVEEKIKIEENFLGVSREILKLVELIEGISTTKDGLKYKNGYLQTKESFAKQLYISDFRPEELGINNEAVWRVLKEKYKNPVEIIEKMKIQLGEIETTIHSDYLKEKNRIIKSIRKDKDEILSLCTQTARKVEEAINIIDLLKEKQKQIKGDLSRYKQNLVKKKGEMSEEVYQKFLKDSAEMDIYIGKDIDRIIAMRSCLVKNLAILKKTEELLPVDINADKEKMTKITRELETITSLWKEYNTKKLKFKYGELTQKITKDPRDTIKRIDGNGILDWVLIKNDNVSNASLPIADALFQKFGEKAENTTSISLIASKGKESSVTEALNEFQKNFNEDKETDGEKKLILQKTLLNEYYLEHFKGYQGQAAMQNTVLQYEQEYLLMGKKKDTENLKGVVNQILGMRTILNFVYVLTDSERKAEAYGMAAGIIGFTGIEPLIRLTQMSILLTLSYEEAIIDTAALMDGKQIDFFKTKKNFSLSFPEMFLFKKELVKEKVRKLEEKKKALAFSYKDYIRLFLGLQDDKKLVYRAMDIIESNMKERYTKKFSMERCVFGFEAKAKVEVAPKFFHILNNRFFQSLKTKWEVSVMQSNAY